MKITKDPLAFILALVIGAALVLIIASSVFAQGLGNNRVGMEQFLRMMVGKELSHQLPDTTAQKFLNYSQRQTKLALGVKTRMNLDTIVTSTNIIQYALNTDAISGSLVLIVHRRNTESGGVEVSLQEVPFDMIGKSGSSTLSTYAVAGQNLVLGQSPGGDDTLIVYYSQVSPDLDLDTTSVNLAEEDETAMVLLAVSWTFLRSERIQDASLTYQMWRDYMALKGVTFGTVAGQGQ